VLLEKFTFRSLILNFSCAHNDSVQARSPKKIKAQKSVYSLWLICKFNSYRYGMIFPYGGPLLASTNNSCDITLKHALLSKFQFTVKISLQSAQIIILSVMISQPCLTVYILN